MLEIRLLGQFSVSRDGQPVEIPSRPAQSLLAYLLMNPEAKHRREKLAGMLWPDSDEENARSNLRHALWRLRKAVGEQHFAADKVTIAFNAESDYWLDLDQLEAPTGGSLEGRIAAVSVYQGELLPGFYDDWVSQERERMHAIFERRLAAALEGLLEQRRWEQALEWAERWIARSQAAEPAYRALMIAYAGLGDMSKAAMAHQRCRKALREGLGVEPSKETDALFDQLSRGDVRPPEGPGAARHNLPAPQTPFIGRQVELQAILDRLCDPECRLLTLLGPGGIGKTRLALEAGGRLVDSFRDGIWFVPLALVSSSELLAPAIVEALPFDLSGADAASDQLREFLRQKHLLLILDGFERVLEGADLISQLLSSDPQVKFLVTSWERLSLKGEWLEELEGMPVPSVGADTPVVDFDIVRLFVQSARRVQSEFELDPQDEAAMIRICHLVDGLPLAIELAATWTRMLSLHEIGDEIEAGLDILATKARDVPERHRSLRAIFDYSWQLLSEVERQVLGKLAVFQGGFRREEAIQVADASLMVLSNLADRSYLQVAGGGRYEIQELLRRYSYAELGKEASKLQEISARHAEVYGELLEQWAEALRGGRREEALQVLGPEIENLRSAWRWAIEAQDVELLSKALDGLWLFYDIRSWFQEGFEALGRAVEVFRKIPKSAIRWGAGSGLARALARQGWFSWRLGKYREAQQLADDSLAASREEGAPGAEAFCLDLLGRIAFARGEFAEAKRLCRESLSLWREVGDPWGMAIALFDLGLAAHGLGEYSEAKLPYQEGLQIFRQIGYQYGATFSFESLGRVARSLVEFKEAKRLCLESLAIRRELDDPWGVAACLDSLSAVECGLGEFEQAKQACLESLEFRRRLEDRRGMATALSNLGHISLQIERKGEAKAYLEEALAIRRELGDRKGMASSLNVLGEIALLVGDLEAAQLHNLESLEIRRAIGDRAGTAASFISLGKAALARQDWQAAAASFREALRTSEQLEATPLSLEALAGYAMGLSKAGQAVPAAEILGLIAHHEAASGEVKSRAEAILQELRAEHPEEEIDSACSRGMKRDASEVAQEILTP